MVNKKKSCDDVDGFVRLKKVDSGVFIIKTNNVLKYRNISGVWAMFGKFNPCEEYICLEVGQSNNIYEELQYDIDCLLQDYSNIDLRKRYTARRLFKEFNTSFDVCVCDSNRTNAKYRVIATTFVDIKIFLIAHDNDKINREKIELEFAVDNKAMFWNAWGKQRRMAKEYYKSTHTFG